jgi:hypothetical protein
MRIFYFSLCLTLCTNVFANSVYANSFHHNDLAIKLSAQKAFIANINQCNAPKKLSKMMQIALKNVDDYAARASNAGHFEEIMLNNPSCFITAINELPKRECEQMAEVFIQETFFYPRDEIKKSLTKAKEYRKSCMAA